MCSNMEGPGDYHTKWSKSGKDTYHMISLKDRILKKWYKWTYLQNRNRLINLEKELIVTWGDFGGRARLGIWDDMYALLHLK